MQKKNKACPAPYDGWGLVTPYKYKLKYTRPKLSWEIIIRQYLPGTASTEQRPWQSGLIFLQP